MSSGVKNSNVKFMENFSTTLFTNMLRFSSHTFTSLLYQTIVRGDRPTTALKSHYNLKSLIQVERDCTNMTGELLKCTGVYTV